MLRESFVQRTRTRQPSGISTRTWEPVEALLRVFEFAGRLKYTAPYGFAAAASAV
jgi:hypothetical protein